MSNISVEAENRRPTRTSWRGEVYFVNAKGESQKLVDTKEGKINASDIEYDAKRKTLFVPTFLCKWCKRL